VRRRRLVEGDQGARRRRPHRGAGRHERDERHGGRTAESVAAGGARRAGARIALGTGVAAGDRPRAVRGAADAVGGLIDDALRAAVGAPSGVSFIDFPMDHVFSEAQDAGGPGALADPPAPATPDGNALDTAVRLLAEAQRPVIMAGTNVWWGHAEKELRALSESLRIPVLMNGMARGAVPADHDLAFSRARSKALGEADVAVVVGVPMDFRLGFGGVFGAQTKLIVADRAEPD